MELGTWFAFIGNQHGLEFNKTEYSVDMLLYNRGIRCLVAIFSIYLFEIEKGKREKNQIFAYL